MGTKDLLSCSRLINQRRTSPNHGGGSTPPAPVPLAAGVFISVLSTAAPPASPDCGSWSSAGRACDPHPHPLGKHSSLDDGGGWRTWIAASCPFVSPNLSHRGRQGGAGVPGNRGRKGMEYPNARPKDKGSVPPCWACIPRNPKGLNSRSPGVLRCQQGGQAEPWGDPSSPCGH